MLIRNRFSAVKLDRPEFVTAQIHLLPMALDLHGDIDVPALCAALPVDNPALIVIDTLARAMGEWAFNSGDALLTGLVRRPCLAH